MTVFHQVDTCHILLIDRSQDSQLDAIVAVQEAKLTISSKLLRPAAIVEPGQD